MRNFFEPNDEKLTEKAFTKSLISSVITILLCIAVLCSVTYAWFITETSSTSNTIMSGSFDLTVAVTKDGNDIPVIADADGYGCWACELNEEGIYTVHLTIKEESSVMGHCIVRVGDLGDKHTAAVVKNTEADNSDAADFTFTVVVTEKTKIIFEPCWGAFVNPDIENGGNFTVSEASSEESSEEQTDSEQADGEVEST